MVQKRKRLQQMHRHWQTHSLLTISCLGCPYTSTLPLPLCPSPPLCASSPPSPPRHRVSCLRKPTPAAVQRASLAKVSKRWVCLQAARPNVTEPHEKSIIWVAPGCSRRPLVNKINHFHHVLSQNDHHGSCFVPPTTRRYYQHKDYT